MAQDNPSLRRLLPFSPLFSPLSLNNVICKHLFAYMLAYMGKSSYLCSVIKKEIVKQLKIIQPYGNTVKPSFMKISEYYKARIEAIKEARHKGMSPAKQWELGMDDEALHELEDLYRDAKINDYEI